MTLGDLSFNMAFIGNDDAPTPYTEGVSYAITQSETLGQGNDAGEIGSIYADEQTLNNSSVTIDLLTSLDRFGVALALAQLAMFYVESVALGADGGSIEVRPGASNGQTNLLGTSSAVKLTTGTACMFWTTDWTQNGWVCDSTHKTITVIETNTGAAPVKIVAWGRRTP